MSFLKSVFFKKSDKSNYPSVNDFSFLSTDLHSHLLPGIDDGVKTLDESMAMIRSLADLGYKKLITTPHIMSDHFRNTPNIINESLAQVRDRMKQSGLTITLNAAAEYYIDEQFLEKAKQGNLLTLSGKYLLVEISYMNPPENLTTVMFELIVMGYIPVLAHPERYPYWYTKFEKYHSLKEAGVLFQLNINSLAGYYGPEAKKIAERMIDEKLIDFAGSDLHGQRHLDALRRSLSEKYLWKLATQGLKNSIL